MKTRILLFAFLANFFLHFPTLDGEAQQPQVSIQILATFDYPGVGNSTLPQKINDQGNVAGFFIDSGGVTRGFARARNGTFSSPIVEPNDTGNLTQVRGINAANILCGYFFDTANHGFFRAGATFTQFDVPDALSTFLLALNDAGNFAGDFDPPTGGRLAFVSISGNIVPFGIPGATMNSAFSINNSNEISGDYLDSGSITHGFFRDSTGRLRFPIDPPGATATFPFGINDKRIIVGRYTDGAGTDHGFILKMPNSFVSFDYPGATSTSLNGINNQGLVCGRYDDGSGILHGFIGRIR